MVLLAGTTMNDLRRYPRINSPNGTILAWQSGNQRFVSHLQDLGLGGMFIRTAQPGPLGTFIQLLLDVPAGEVRARAVVQRSEFKQGMGVKFVAMQPKDRGRFIQWIKKLSA